MFDININPPTIIIIELNGEGFFLCIALAKELEIYQRQKRYNCKLPNIIFSTGLLPSVASCMIVYFTLLLFAES